MDPTSDFPNERLRWMDDLLAELERFAERHDLAALQGDLSAARETLRSEADRVNRTPGHTINRVRGLRDN